MKTILGEILTASDSISRVLAQYHRLVKQDPLMKDGLKEILFEKKIYFDDLDNVLSILNDLPSNSNSQTLIDLAAGSTSMFRFSRKELSN